MKNVDIRQVALESTFKLKNPLLIGIYFPQPQSPLTKPVRPADSLEGDFLGETPASDSNSSSGISMWLPAKSKNNGLQGIGLEQKLIKNAHNLNEVCVWVILNQNLPVITWKLY